MRSGEHYLQSLRDGRTVYIDGKPVEDVAAHPAFQGVTRSLAATFDTVADEQNALTFVSPESGGPANKAFMIPRSREDLASRRSAISAMASVSHGFVGRGPDHVAAFMAGFASAPEVFDRGERSLGENVTRYYRKLLDEDLFVTYTIIPPQIERGTTAHGWEEELLQAGVLEESESGMVVRGSQMLGTSTAVSDELFVSCIKPLGPEDERYAISFVIPVDTPGLKVYCRRPYATSKPSSFDYPLSTRFDEPDALVVFDDVQVPWDRVFVYRDVEAVRGQFFETPAHVLGNSQAQIRLIHKIQFLAGIARKIAAMNGIDRIPSVQEKLGELASVAAIVEGMVVAAEAESIDHPSGAEIPNPRFLYGAMGLQSELYPRALSLLRELAGGGVIQQPSSYRELVNEETSGDMARYLQSREESAEDRVKLFKLAWDAVGSEFGSRHHQYEMFYAGAPFVVRGYAYRNYGYDEVVREVEAFLASYDLSAELPTVRA
jgi:4-hydroxyphenylacetate 3-monooxygenase